MSFKGNKIKNPQYKGNNKVFYFPSWLIAYFRNNFFKNCEVFLLAYKHKLEKLVKI